MDALQNMPRYPAYKASGVEWLGEIPEGWEIKKLKFSCKINSESLPDTTPAKTLIEYVDIGSISFEKGIEGTESFFFGDAPSRARRIASAGDTVVSTVRTYLKAISFVDEKASKYIYSTGFAVLSPSVMLASKYLSNFIKSSSFTNQVDGVAKGMNYPAVNSSELSNLYVVAPSILEQQAIAKFLDEKTGQIDEAIAIKAQQIELLKERKQIIIQNAVTRGLNPAAPLRDSGIDWIGEIPEHWEVKKIKHLFRENTVRTQTGTETLLSLRMEIGLVPHNDVSDKHIPCENLIDYKMVNEGQLVMNRMRAAIGIFGLATAHGLVSPDYAVFDISDSVVSEYYLAMFKLPLIGTQFRLASKGMGTGSSGFMRLYTDAFGDISIPVPPKEEQKRLFRFFGETTEETANAIQILEQQIDRLKEYKTTLINSAVTGKIRVPLGGSGKK